MVIWVLAAWSSLAVPVLVVFGALARAGHEEDVAAYGYVGPDVPSDAPSDLYEVVA